MTLGIGQPEPGEQLSRLTCGIDGRGVDRVEPELGPPEHGERDCSGRGHGAFDELGHGVVERVVAVAGHHVSRSRDIDDLRMGDQLP